MALKLRGLLFVGMSLPAAAMAQITQPDIDAGSQSPATQSKTVADGAGIGDIVVTAQRREESLQRVPVAVTAIGSAALAARGITGLASLSTQSSPGLVVTPFAGAESTLAFSIRGVSTPDPGTGLAEQGVAIYSDGVPLGRAVGTGVDLADVERIEVLRGPQGTLFGRNAQGGAIQFVSKRPTGKFGGRLEGLLGNYDARRALLHVDLPEIANISLKFSGLVDRHDGWTRNRENGLLDSVTQRHSFGLKDQKGFRIGALWQPTSDFDAYYSFDYSDLDFTNAYNFRTGGFTPAEPAFCAVPTYAALCASGATLAANIYQATYAPEFGRPTTSRLPQSNPLSRNEVRGHGLTLNWRAGDNLTLKSITGYRQVRERSQNHLGGSIAWVQFLPNSAFDGAGGDDVPAGTTAAATGVIATLFVKQKQFSQELQAIGELGRLEFTAGLFYFNEKVTDQRDTFFSLPYIYLGQPGTLQPLGTDPFPLAPSLQSYKAEANSYAAYFQGTYTPAVFDDKLKLTAGIRYTRDKKVFLREIHLGVPDATLAPIFKHSRIDPAFTIGYQANDDLNLYIKYSQAYRAGGTAIRNKLALTTYDPEVNKTFEAGFKAALFDRIVRWNLAVYRSRISGYQLGFANSAVDPSSTDTINLNDSIVFTGDTTIKFEGIENEITIAPTRNLSLGINYSYMHAHGGPKLLRLAPGLPPVAQFSIISAPEHQISLSVDHLAPLGNGDLAIATHVDYNYNTDYIAVPVRFNFTKEEKAELDTLNVKIGLQGINLGGAIFTVSAFGRNILQSKNYNYPYQTSTADFTKMPFGGAAILAAPRTYGVEFRAVF